MKITTVFDAVQYGTFEEFKELYNGDVNQLFTYGHLNLLLFTLTDYSRLDDKVKIIKFLLEEGIDVNCIGGRFDWNALHLLIRINRNPDVRFLLEVAELLIEYGIDVNQKNKKGMTPLMESIVYLRNSTEELIPFYILLLNAGANYKLKNNNGKSSLDYAKEFSWRNAFLDIVKEYENEGR
ncbi:ankyrin repeat domain-containing protein [Streptococcus oricebi]|uniref:Ankyrin repeat domain-containing protein n=1 Tax=Streptococcus oricebi TaxID=1547447 RepID=A0ABS5B306_9STRE|nr:ankyrin repeat domain-containing protein [Streptococcus oricebi]MBP2623222.1 ankyrin repeat domain-containing protein [Streptococcus oricebi]